jgi:hypothetical protein
MLNCQLLEKPQMGNPSYPTPISSCLVAFKIQMPLFSPTYLMNCQVALITMKWHSLYPPSTPRSLVASLPQTKNDMLLSLPTQLLNCPVA